jgi:hypothetical protein
MAIPDFGDSGDGPGKSYYWIRAFFLIFAKKLKSIKITEP